MKVALAPRRMRHTDCFDFFLPGVLWELLAYSEIVGDPWTTERWRLFLDIPTGLCNTKSCKALLECNCSTVFH